MPNLVAEILLNQITPKELLLRLQGKGDRQGKKTGDSGLGKAMSTPEARRAFLMNEEGCQVQNVDALYELSLLLQHGREARSDSHKININFNKEAICLALIFMTPTTDKHKTLKEDVKRRLEKLYSTHFKGQTLPSVTVLSHIHHLSLLLATQDTEEMKSIPPSPHHSRSRESSDRQSEASGLVSETSSEEDFALLEEKYLSSEKVDKEIQTDTTPEVSIAITPVLPVSAPMPVSEVAKKEVKNDEDAEDAKQAPPSSKNSYHEVADALNTMNTRLVMPYDGETIAAYKDKQKQYIVDLLPSWNLDQTRYLLRVMIKAQSLHHHDSRFEILRLETTPLRTLFGLINLFGPTQTWQDLGYAVKEAVIKKLIAEKRPEYQPAIIKTKLEKRDYDNYHRLLSTSLGRFYQKCYGFYQPKKEAEIIDLFEENFVIDASRKKARGT